MPYFRRPSLLCSFLFCALHSSGQVTVSTGQYNNSRTGANLAETVLNRTNVNVNTFGKLFTWNVDGWVYAQPLYIPNVLIAGVPHNVVYVATMSNSIYAFDADQLSASPLWQKNYGAPVPVIGDGKTICPTNGSGPLGILSTPVIDPVTSTMYFVTTTPGTAAQGGGYVFYINAVDLQSGTPKFHSPTLITASVKGTGYDNVGGTVTLNNVTQSQRAALLLSHGIVYAAFGNCGPDIDPWHGWLLGFYANWLPAHTNPWNATANGSQGGIWQSNRGPVADAVGNVYVSTGNGSAGSRLYGSSLVKLNQWGGPLDFYTPPNWLTLNQYDMDISSSGPLEIPGTGLLVFGGKEGVIYVVNEAKVRTIVQSFQATPICPALKTSGCHGIHSLAYWGTATAGSLYVWGGKDTLRVYAFQNGVLAQTPASENPLASDWTGANTAISANGSDANSGILWAAVGSSGRNGVVPAFYAFDASNVANELWDSNQNVVRDGVPNVAKWGTPTIANGRVYVPANANQSVYVFGLLPQ